MSNIRTAGSTGGNHYVGPALLPDSSGLAIDYAFCHPAPRTAKAQRSHQRGGCISGATVIGTASKLPDTAPADSSTNYGGNIYSPCYIPAGR